MDPRIETYYVGSNLCLEGFVLFMPLRHLSYIYCCGDFTRRVIAHSATMNIDIFHDINIVRPCTFAIITAIELSRLYGIF